MDLDAEMAKLQAEARQELERRRQQGPAPDEPPEELPRQEIDPALLGLPGGAQGLLQRAQRLGAGAAVKTTAAWSVPAKVALVVGGIVGTVLLWKVLLAPLLHAMIAFAILALVIAAIVKLVLWKRGGGETPGEEP